MKKILLSISIFMLAFLANAQNPYPVLPIDSVQFVNSTKLSETFPNDSSDYINPFFKNAQYGDTVRFEGIVMMDPRLYGLSTSRKATVLQADTIARPWGGIEVMCEPAGTGKSLAQLLNETHFYDNLKPGNKVRVTGVIRTFRGSSGIPAGSRQGETQVNMIKADANWENGVEFVDLNSYKVKPAIVRIDSLMTGSTGAQVQKKLSGEKWEGTYVELRDVTVASRTISGSRWFWAVSDGNGNIIDVGDFCAQFRNDNNSDSVLLANRFTPPTIGTRLSYLKGVIVENLIGGQYRYQIAPLSPNDLGLCNICPPNIGARTRNPVIATPSTPVTISASITGDTTIKSAKLYYTTKKTNQFDTISMQPVVAVPNLWAATIPAYPQDSVVRYWVKATDEKGIYINAPDSLASNSMYLVTDGMINSIQEIQKSIVANNTTIWNGDLLTGIDVRGIVTSTNMAQGSTINILTVQNGTTPNSGLIVDRVTTDNTNSWKVGDSVKITEGLVRESFNQTTITNIVGSVISSGNALPNSISPVSIDSIATISASATLRSRLAPWEGMLMNFDSVYVINTNADGPGGDFGEFLINKDSSKITGLRVDDIASKLPDGFNKNLASKQFMNQVKGIFYLSFSNWKLEPRDSNDIDFSRTPDTQKPIITLIGKSVDSLEKNKSYVDPGATAMDNKDGNITSKIIRIGILDSSKVGTYILKYTVADNAGNRDTVNRTVIVYTPVGINSNELVFALSNIYPNPASNLLHLSVSGFQTLPLTASIIDISGRELITKTFNTKTIEHNFELTTLQNGIYFCTLQSASGSKTIKFVVNK